MELLQNVDSNTAILLGVSCSVLCIGGFFVLQFLQVLTGLLGFVIQFIEIPLSMFQSCPCGCLALLGISCGVCAVVGAVASVIPNCGTAEAVNLCRLLGY